MRYARVALGVLLAFLPSWLKVLVYRHAFGFQIGRGVRIGPSPLIGVRRCRIGDHARIGWGNVFYQVDELVIDSHARVGVLNLFRGGERIHLGSYTTVLRLNVFNAIIGGDFVGRRLPVLELGAGVSVSTGHWLDFSAGIRIGDHSIIGGRNSSFWTHNRQRSRPIEVGHHCYLASELRAAPGVEVAPFCIVALGSVLTGRYPEPFTLIGGNPAAVVRPLGERDLFLVVNKTRPDVPDDLAHAHLGPDLLATSGVGAAPDPSLAR